MHLYRTIQGPAVDDGGTLFLLTDDWDELLCREDLLAYLRGSGARANRIDRLPELLAPVGTQEIWAAGVTYLRSRAARMEESKDAGGGDFYDRVYIAERPELFFKSPGYRVVAPEGEVRIRSDASWTVPEPELVLAISPKGRIYGYTIGNDMSSRDIEGENPLYLPQAKTYDGSCAIGPCILVTDDALAPETAIRLRIVRQGAAVFEDSIEISRIRRSFTELAGFLYRELSFPSGVFLMTGTGIVPPDSFTLAPGDRVSISIDGIGSLTNVVGG